MWVAGVRGRAHRGHRHPRVRFRASRTVGHSRAVDREADVRLNVTKRCASSLPRPSCPSARALASSSDRGDEPTSPSPQSVRLIRPVRGNCGRLNIRVPCGWSAWRRNGGRARRAAASASRIGAIGGRCRWPRQSGSSCYLGADPGCGIEPAQPSVQDDLPKSPMVTLSASIIVWGDGYFSDSPS